MEIIGGIFYFLLGISVGSFLNVVILRYGEKSIGGRSHCPSCGKLLSWRELIPIFSFIFQKGRCASCGASISWQYPLVELGTGLLFLSLFVKFVPEVSTTHVLQSTFYALIFSLLVVIFVYDFYHKIIPDLFVYTFSALAFLSILNFEFGAWNLFGILDLGFRISASLLQLFAGLLIASPFALLWLLSRGRWMGLGDAKLALGIGWLLGLSKGVTAVMLSFWIGAVVSIAILLLQRIQLSDERKPLTMKSEIPFAPFLIAGLLIVFFFDIDIILLLVP